MLLAEGCSRPRPQRRRAGERVDHGEGEDEHCAARIGDRRRHRSQTNARILSGEMIAEMAPGSAPNPSCAS